jgi:drug/metabolite transporter (DMT)-like permease
MFWFTLALIGSFLYAITNHIDKILLEKYFKSHGIGTLILFSSTLSLIAVPFLYFFDNSVLDLSLQNILILILVGIINIAVLWFYLKALFDEEASVAIVFYQLVPVLGLILGYLFLGEVLTKTELIAMAIIILGTTIISFEINSENKFKLRKKTIGFMLVASFLWATESVIFKFVALEENVVRSLFWEHLTLGFFGILMFIFIESYRNNFLKTFKSNSKKVLGINVMNESLYMLGNISFSFAYLLAPIALVLLSQSFQPIFVFIIGVILTLFFPKISVEKITIRDTVQKLLAIFITGIGTYLLLS